MYKIPEILKPSPSLPNMSRKILPRLTDGAILNIINKSDGISKIENDDKPILQVLGYRNISESSGPARNRILLSDGKYLYSYVLLATHLNPLIAFGKLETFTIVQLFKYAVNQMPNTGKDSRKLIVILDLQPLIPGEEVGEIIGDPQSLTVPEVATVKKVAVKKLINELGDVADSADENPQPVCQNNKEKVVDDDVTSPTKKMKEDTVEIGAYAAIPNQSGIWIIQVIGPKKADDKKEREVEASEGKPNQRGKWIIQTTKAEADFTSSVGGSTAAKDFPLEPIAGRSDDVEEV